MALANIFHSAKKTAFTDEINARPIFQAPHPFRHRAAFLNWSKFKAHIAYSLLGNPSAKRVSSEMEYRGRRVARLAFNKPRSVRRSIVTTLMPSALAASLRVNVNFGMFGLMLDVPFMSGFV